MFIKKAESGIVVEPGDIDGFKDAILKLKGDYDLHEELGNNGITFLKKNMVLSINSTIYEKIFSKIE